MATLTPQEKAHIQGELARIADRVDTHSSGLLRKFHPRAVQLSILAQALRDLSTYIDPL